MSATTYKSQDQIREELIAGLRELGGQLANSDEDVVREGIGFRIPGGWSLRMGGETLLRLAKEEEQITDFVHTTRYRPLDTAYNALEAIKETFGTFFTKQNFWDDDTMIEFQIGNNETVQIAVGSWFEVPGVCEAAHMSEGLQFHIKFDGYTDDEAGDLGKVIVKCPKGLHDLVSEVFRRIDERLEEHSLYRGKYIDGRQTPQFLDPGTITGDSIILNEDVQRTIEAKVMLPIRYTDKIRAAGYEVGRAILLEGDFGTGKTETMRWAVSEAILSGWTAIHVKPGRDDLFKAIQFAGLYGPCIIICEDVDTIGGSDQDPTFMSRVLEAFDGATAKGHEIIILLTTNHVERIDKGLLRPGRFDSIVSFSAPDDRGIERLIELYTPELDCTADLAPVVEAMRGWTPAFIQAACQIAGEWNMARNFGEMVGYISADDLLFAAKSYEAHRAVQDRAKTAEPSVTLDSLFKQRMAEVQLPIADAQMQAVAGMHQITAAEVNENVDNRVERAISDNVEESELTRDVVRELPDHPSNGY